MLFFDMILRKFRLMTRRGDFISGRRHFNRAAQVPFVGDGSREFGIDASRNLYGLILPSLDIVISHG